MSEIKFDDFFLVNELQRNFVKICSLKESIFLFIFSLQLKNDTQEPILRVRGDRNFENSRYERAIAMLMTSTQTEIWENHRGIQQGLRHIKGQRGRKAWFQNLFRLATVTAAIVWQMRSSSISPTYRVIVTSGHFLMKTRTIS